MEAILNSSPAMHVVDVAVLSFSKSDPARAVLVVRF
jgi:hypothetical protein